MAIKLNIITKFGHIHDHLEYMKHEFKNHRDHIVLFLNHPSGLVFFAHITQIRFTVPCLLAQTDVFVLRSGFLLV